MPERWKQVKAMLAAALERAPEERDEYLNQVCVENSLRSEVQSLLAAHCQANNGFLGLADGDPDDLASGTRLGPYEIPAPLGEGMGKVSKPRDNRLYRFWWPETASQLPTYCSGWPKVRWAITLRTF